MHLAPLFTQLKYLLLLLQLLLSLRFQLELLVLSLFLELFIMVLLLLYVFSQVFRKLSVLVRLHKLETGCAIVCSV